MTEQERFEQSVAARLHPARFTKVGENPLLGWNGAKDSDYVNIEMQQHWTTWQAATAQVPESCVLDQAIAICENLANEWESDAVVSNKNYAGECASKIKAIKAAQENDQ